MLLVARGLYCHSRGCGISISLKGVVSVVYMVG